MFILPSRFYLGLAGGLFWNSTKNGEEEGRWVSVYLMRIPNCGVEVGTPRFIWANCFCHCRYWLDMDVLRSLGKLVRPGFGLGPLTGERREERCGTSQLTASFVEPVSSIVEAQTTDYMLKPPFPSRLISKIHLRCV